MKLKLLLLITAALLAACSSKLEGVYAEKSGAVKYTFSKQGTVLYQMGQLVSVEVPYEMDGNKIKVQIDGGVRVMTLMDDGTIRGMMGETLIKQKKS